MKKIVLLITLLCSFAMLAPAPQEYFDAVEQSEEMSMLKEEGNIVSGINHIASFGFAGGHQFAVFYKSSAGDQEVKTAHFYTRDTNSWDQNIIVTRKDPKVRKSYPSDCGIVTGIFRAK